MRSNFNKKVIKKYNLQDHKQYIYMHCLQLTKSPSWAEKKKKKNKGEEENVDVQTKLSLNVSAIPTTALAGQVQKPKKGREKSVWVCSLI